MSADDRIRDFQVMREERAHIEHYYVCASLYGDPMNAHRWRTNTETPEVRLNNLFSGVGIRAANRFFELHARERHACNNRLAAPH